MNCKTKLILVIIFMIFYLIYFTKEHNVSNRDYLGEVLLSGRVEKPIDIIKYSNQPASFKLNDNKISSF